jgi:hypothetical protein
MAMPFIYPDLEKRIKDWPPEEQEKARRSHEQFIAGIMQLFRGNARVALLDKFLQTIGSNEQSRIEFLADQIVNAAASNRLKKITMRVLATVFEQGAKWAIELNSRGDDMTKKLESLHILAITEEAEKLARSRSKSKS